MNSENPYQSSSVVHEAVSPEFRNWHRIALHVFIWSSLITVGHLGVLIAVRRLQFNVHSMEGLGYTSWFALAVESCALAFLAVHTLKRFRWLHLLMCFVSSFLLVALLRPLVPSMF